MYVWVVARLPQRLKSMFFSKNFLHSRYPSLLRTLHSKNVQKMLILVFEATSALSGQNGFFPSFSSLCLVRKKFLLILPLQAMRTNAIFFYYRLFKMNFYFQIWFQTKKKSECSLVHIFWQGLNMFFYILFQRIASEFSCKKMHLVYIMILLFGCVPWKLIMHT